MTEEPPLHLDDEQIRLTLAAYGGLRAQIEAMLRTALTANSPQAMRAVQWLGAIRQTESRLQAILAHRQGREGGDTDTAPAS